jgi:hypothetical protein
LLFAAGAALAQTVIRKIPEDAKLGHLTHLQMNFVRLDGRAVKLAPGGIIRGENNLIVLPTALPPNSLVKYQLDGNGELAAAWILTPEEAGKAGSAPLAPGTGPRSFP